MKRRAAASQEAPPAVHIDSINVHLFSFMNGPPGVTAVEFSPLTDLPLELGAEFTCRVIGIERTTTDRRTDGGL